MYQKLLPLLLVTLFSTFIDATDLNTTTIINQATQAVQPMQAELNAVITESNESIVIENNVSIPVETAVVAMIVDENFTEANGSQIIPIEINTTKENNESKEKKIFNLTEGNSLKGKNIFIRHLKDDCNTTAYEFAGNYAQEEWEEIAQSGKFQETIFKLCPNVQENFKEHWSSDLYQFFYEHANDSENIPEC